MEEAELIFFADLRDKVDSLPKDKPIAVTCSVGNRSSIAVSILERAGFKNVNIVLGGMTAWTKLGYPIKKKTAALSYSVGVNGHRLANYCSFSTFAHSFCDSGAFNLWALRVL